MADAPWNKPTLNPAVPTPDLWLTKYAIGQDGYKQVVVEARELDEKNQPKMGTGGTTYIVWDSKLNAPIPVKDSLDGREAIDVARQKVLEGLSPNGIRKLKDTLLKGRFISKTEYNRDDYNTGLNEAIRAYSVSVVQDYQLRAPNDPNAKFGQSFSTYLGGVSSGSGSGGKDPVTDQTQETTSFSTRVETNRLLEKHLGLLLGQAPTTEDYNLFYDEVNKAERNAKTKVTTETDRSADGTQVDTKQKVVGGRLGEDEYFVMAAKIGVKQLAKIGGDTVLLDKLIKGGSRVAQDMSALKAHANDQGIDIDDKQALNYVMSGLDQPQSATERLAIQKERINQSAITFYSNNKALSDHMAKGGTYKEIADIYASMKFKKLGKPVLNATQDADVRKAISLGMSGSDFDRDLQSRPEWFETDEAHQIAGSYLDTILTKFGFAG